MTIDENCSDRSYLFGRILLAPISWNSMLSTIPQERKAIVLLMLCDMKLHLLSILQKRLLCCANN